MPEKSAMTLPSAPMVTFTPEPPLSVRVTPAALAEAATPVLFHDPTGHGGVVGVGVADGLGPTPELVVQPAATASSRPTRTSGRRRRVFIFVSIRSGGLPPVAFPQSRAGQPFQRP